MPTTIAKALVTNLRLRSIACTLTNILVLIAGPSYLKVLVDLASLHGFFRGESGLSITIILALETKRSQIVTNCRPFRCNWLPFEAL